MAGVDSVVISSNVGDFAIIDCKAARSSKSHMSDNNPVRRRRPEEKHRLVQAFSGFTPF